jgi:hypothetical protein
MKLFQMYEDDLQKMEALLPMVVDRLGMAMNDPALQVAAEELKRIVSDVRWNYGPPSEVKHIAAERGDQA